MFVSSAVVDRVAFGFRNFLKVNSRDSVSKSYRMKCAVLRKCDAATCIRVESTAESIWRPIRLLLMMMCLSAIVLKRIDCDIVIFRERARISQKMPCRGLRAGHQI